MDPPSYGRGPKGEIWKIEDTIYPLLLLTRQILSDKPLFFLLNSYTTGLQAGVLTHMLKTSLAALRPAYVESGEVGLPIRDTELILPCGCAGRVVF